MCPEAALREKRCELKKRELVCGKHEQCISQKFISARAEVIEVPALFQHFRKLGDTNEVR